MRIVVATMAIVIAGSWSCRTTNNGDNTSVGKDAASDAAMIANIKAALKEGGCLGCHANTDESDWTVWAQNTKDSYDRLVVEEKPGFDPTAFDVTGVYRAYPEYFEIYFSQADKFADFAQKVRPDPGMRVKGTGDDQKNAFIKIRDSMLDLAAKPAP